MKSRFKSKTHWFNTVMGALVLAEANFAALKPALGESTFAYISFALIIGNYFLREMTKEPVGNA